jgi:osmotically-inducible protein OsmY
MIKTDRQICEAVACELKWDPKVNQRGISVQSDRSAVALLGTVGSWAERLAAQEAAQRVIGVRQVDNRIEVELSPEERRTDAELVRSARDALDCDVFISKVDIGASASSGQIILEGQVDYCCHRDYAERLVRNIRGVRRILNQISVRIAPGDAHQVQESIESALERRAYPDAQRIDLDVHDGKVILSGIVRSWAERESVVGAAKGTLGVRSVDDRLWIEP